MRDIDMIDLDDLDTMDACKILKTCTMNEARRHIDNHDIGVDAETAWAEFLDEFGDHDSYDLTELFGWLGY